MANAIGPWQELQPREVADPFVERTVQRGKGLVLFSKACMHQREVERRRVAGARVGVELREHLARLFVPAGHAEGLAEVAQPDAGTRQVHGGAERLNRIVEAAGGAQTRGSRALHAAIKAATAAHQREQKAQPRATSSGPRVPFTLGRPQTFTNAQVTVQPLLTPDQGRLTSMYVDNVLALITSARRRLYMQTQYVHPSDQPGDRNFMRLVDALAEAVKRGVDVRLITSQYENTPQYVEQLHKLGLSGVLRIQERVHNKGIVVDSGTVLVSSQNWSADGTLRNRDAGVIIRHAGIARYFEQIFLQDWEKRADVRVK